MNQESLLEQRASTALANIERTYLTPRETAAYLRVVEITLAKWRVSGGGPRFHKWGRSVRYALADLKLWAEGRARRSTSDTGEHTRRAARQPVTRG